MIRYAWTFIVLCQCVTTAFFVSSERKYHSSRCHNNGVVQASMRSSSKLQSAGTSIATTTTTVGFIGCGTIASSICEGLLSSSGVLRRNSDENDNGDDAVIKISSVSVSRRSEHRSTSLKEKFEGIVTIYDDNQDIIDKSDIVFLCVLPQQTSDILKELQFDSTKHTLISLVATSNLQTLSNDSGLDPNNVYKMICLPPVAKSEGICLVTPKLDSSASSDSMPTADILKAMFSILGGWVDCETEKIMEAMMIPGCLMGPLYGILKNNRDWLIKQGVPPKDASYFVGKQYSGIMQDALRQCDEPNRFDDLIAEQTPGGLNEQSLGNLDKLGVFQAYDQAMDAILARIEGRSDGFI